MRSNASCALVALLLAALAGCHNGQVLLRRAPGQEAYVWQDLIAPEQCGAFYQDLPYEVKAGVGYARGRDQELGAFTLNAKLRWNDTVGPVGGFFEDLCSDHNAGLVSVSEFEKRKTQLTDAVAGLTGLKQKLDSAMDDYGAARQQEADNRGAEGEGASAAVAQARQRMDAASQSVEDIIKQATSIVDSLRGKRAEGKVMACSSPRRQP